MTKICKAFPRERNPQIHKHLPKEFIIVYALSVCIDVYMYVHIIKNVFMLQDIEGSQRLYAKEPYIMLTTWF